MKTLIGIVVAFILGAILVGSAYFTVQPGEVVMVKYLGAIQPETYTEGIHRKNPFIGQVIKMNLRAVKVEDSTTVASKDLQQVGISIAVTYQITKDGTMNIYRRFGDDNAVGSNVVVPNIKEAVRSVMANYKAEELVTKRSEVSSEIHIKLQNKLSEFGLMVSDTNIQDISFSDAFNQSIEAKVQAEQNALAEKNKLDKVKYEAQQSIEKAKAEAEKIKIQAEAITKQGGAEYVQLQWIQKWDGKLPTTQLGNQNTPLINIAK